MITVAELIEKLKELPANAEILLTIGWNHSEIEEVGCIENERNVYISGW
ncbi:hypothetical protein P0X51_002810 [Listeria monocytogenes]|nr:hypothetical protein [Listeria monocytogenes]EJB6196356.1 hypothetical protein [Listeria monocytogenes]EJC5378376.1 hypothetical protein [Listeria monocytogenes]EJC5396482.1 hypothetical protein [Listeria monocytogenes]EJI4219856.1 hypothetical protein [Listeria monocytogenes]